jgi:pimeloyl-ACP methyl ester carboxylesterase
MSDQTLLPGITAERVPTSRLTTAVLSVRGRAGWPGPGTWPPQPMLAQTRALLDGYAAAGGRYRETVIQDSGHGPHIDQPEQFRAALAEHLAKA